MSKITEKNGKFYYTAPTGRTHKSPNRNYIEMWVKRYEGTATKAQEVVQEAVKNEFCINERFEFIENYVEMVADGILPSMIITGSGGLGKSYTVTKVLKANGYTDVTTLDELKEGEVLPLKRYRVIKGFSTPKGLYRSLYENKDNVLVIDDCDSVFGDQTAANLLKGALDSTDVRIISWNSEKMDDDLPKSFRFNGSVIFISNLNKDKIPQALRTRSVCVDVSMTLDEKITRMGKIITESGFMSEVPMKTKKLALDTIAINKETANEVSMRSLIQIVRIAQKFEGAKFEKMARYALTN